MTIFKQENSGENMAMALIVVFILPLILMQLFTGFHLSVFIAVILPSIVLTLAYPRAGLMASVILTVLFERFYTLQPIFIGNVAYKLYALDVVLAAVFFAVFLQVISRRVKLNIIASDWLIIFFFLFITVSLFVTLLFSRENNIGTAFSTWKNYLFYGLLYFTVPLLIQTKERVRSFGKIFLLSTAIATMFIGIGMVRGEGLWTEYTPLSTSGIRIVAFPHGFYFSMALIIAFVLSWFWTYKKDWMNVWLIRAMMSVWMLGILGSLMRHLWLGIALTIGGLFVFIFPSEYRKELLRHSRFFGALALSFFVLIFYVSVLFPHSALGEAINGVGSVVAERVISIGNAQDESLSWRGVVWSSALHTLSENAVFGSGFGVNVPVEIGEYREFVEIRNIHNSWLALFVQTGIFGFVLFLIFLAVLAFGLSKKKYDSDFLNAVKIASLGILAFHSMIFLSQPYLETNLLGMFFWLNLGIMRSMYEIYEYSRDK